MSQFVWFGVIAGGAFLAYKIFGQLRDGNDPSGIDHHNNKDPGHQKVYPNDPSGRLKTLPIDAVERYQSEMDQWMQSSEQNSQLGSTDDAWQAAARAYYTAQKWDPDDFDVWYRQAEGFQQVQSWRQSSL